MSSLSTTSLVGLLKLLILSVFCFAVGACADLDDPSPGQAVTIQDVDTASQRTSSPITFIVRNTTATPLYLIAGDSSTLAWSMSVEGTPVQPEQGCSQCVCEQQRCGLCGRAIPDVVELKPGDERVIQWDGDLWMGEPDTLRGSGQCVRPMAANAGEGYRIEVPYATSFEQGEIGRVLVEPLTKGLDFSYPSIRGAEPLIIAL